jgi:aspartate carbamoyltransferase catalytic subunit
MIKHFLSLADFSNAELIQLLDRAQYFYSEQQPDKINHLLKNKIIANVFYEPSTRTRCSFEIAAKKLGAEVVNFSPENSSVKKGESIYDTLKSLESLGVDAIVLRHSDDHVFEELVKKINIPLVNAGAGKFEHPSQGLLDLLTLKQEFISFENLKIGICGDLKHSRVAGSLIVAAKKFGMHLYLCAPKELQRPTDPPYIHCSHLDEIIPELNALVMLRIQLERHEEIELNSSNYLKQFGLTSDRLKKMKNKSIIMHPGPFNRNVEIQDEIIEHPQSRIFKQMANGVFARMSILEYALGGN